MLIKNLYKKIKDNKEFRNYVVWGIISALVNVGTFQLLVLFGVEYKIANIIALIINRIFCYITNKLFVFKTKADTIWNLIKEIIRFFFARLITFFIDYFGVILLTDVVKLKSIYSKIIVAIIVIICNYVFSKLIVFRNSKKDNKTQ